MDKMGNRYDKYVRGEIYEVIMLRHQHELREPSILNLLFQYDW
jgi:hypothetical protein